MKKDKSLIIVICLILVSVGGYYFFSNLSSNLSAKRKCAQEVRYHPKTSNGGAYYSFSLLTQTGYDVRQFETKNEAIDFCVNSL